MRRSFGLLVAAPLFLLARTASAGDGPIAVDDNFAQPPPNAQPVAPPETQMAPGPVDHVQSAPIAAEEPHDWAVLHAGLSPNLGTFGGIGTFELAGGRTRKFYGVTAVSGVRDHAELFVGALQLAIGHAESDDFYGLAQVGLTHADAKDLHGLLQTSVAYAHADSFQGLAQTAVYSRAEDFEGVMQLGVVSSIGEPFGDEGKGFTGGLQAGALAYSSGSFTGIVQAGAMTFTKGDFKGLLQISALSGGVKGTVYAPFQIGGLGAVATSFNGIAQIGGAAVTLKEANGLQIGAGTYAATIHGAQLGVANIGGKVNGVQIGLVNHAESLKGVQIGLVNHATTGAIAEWTSILNIGFGAPDNAVALARD